MKDILNSYSTPELKKEISKTNIKGYSKMKKADIIELMIKHMDKFSHLKMKEKVVKSAPKAAVKSAFKSAKVAPSKEKEMVKLPKKSPFKKPSYIVELFSLAMNGIIEQDVKLLSKVVKDSKASSFENQKLNAYNSGLSLLVMDVLDNPTNKVSNKKILKKLKSRLMEIEEL